jgi:GAF domain-containing protein
VATRIARQPSPAEVFAAVTEEAARLLHFDSAHLIVYERDQTATVVGAYNLRGQALPAGTRVPVEGDNIIGRVFRTQQPARIDDYSNASGPVTETGIGAFTELAAMAIANAAARTELEQVAAEQAALGRVATLVAEAVPPGDVFTAVAAEVAGLFGVPHVGLFRYEREGLGTVIAGAGGRVLHRVGGDQQRREARTGLGHRPARGRL